MLGGLINFTVGLDGIAISPDQRWFYLGPMTSDKLCRVPLQTLLDPALQPDQVASKVEYVGRKPISDGIATDAQGRVILGDDEHGGIMSFDPATHKLTTLARDTKVIWPDGIAVAPNGDIVFTDSAIPAYLDQFGGPPTLARLIAHRPYYVYRLKR
jgi:sugar lactone lactonase YvrE